MYTNRGFLQRHYQLKPTLKPAYELRQPKFQQHFSPSSKFSSPNKTKETLQTYSYSKYSQSSSPNIFSSSPDHLKYPLEITKSYSNLPNNDYSNSTNQKITNRILSQRSLNLASSIFEIYGSGYNYNRISGFSTPLGTGFLITKSIAITANSVIPDEEIASRSFIRFSESPYELHSFDAVAFFYTNKELNFTVLGFVINPTTKKQKIPLEIKEDFILRESDNIYYLNSGNIMRNVTSIDSQFFSYTASNNLLLGTPIFTED